MAMFHNPALNKKPQIESAQIIGIGVETVPMEKLTRGTR